MKKTIVAAMIGLALSSCTKDPTTKPSEQPITVDSVIGKWTFFHTLKTSLPPIGGGPTPSNYSTVIVNTHQVEPDGHYELYTSVRPVADRPYYMDGDTLKCDFTYPDEEYKFRFFVEYGITKAYYTETTYQDTILYTSRGKK